MRAGSPGHRVGRKRRRRSTRKLTDQVYVPARKGSLQIEMLAAARRNGTLAFVIPNRLEALLEELEAGNPVLVLLNLGLSWIPSWHYAVAIGYDLDRAGHAEIWHHGATGDEPRHLHAHLEPQRTLGLRDDAAGPGRAQRQRAIG